MWEAEPYLTIITELLMDVKDVETKVRGSKSKFNKIIMVVVTLTSLDKHNFTYIFTDI